MHTYAENDLAIKRKEPFLIELPGEIYTIEANNKFPDNWKYPLDIPIALMQAAQNQR